jgi:glycosyltransferase involved in cell wall biosynthesis
MQPERLTVLHVIAQLRFGAGRVVADMAIEQARGLEHRVTICVSADADEHWRTDPALVDELGRHGIEVRIIGDFFHREVGCVRRAAATMAGLRTQSDRRVVVHAHTAMAAAVGHWCAPDVLVATCHGWGTGRPAAMDLQDALAYRLCGAVLTYSRHWASRLTEDLGVRNPELIPMGLDFARFPVVSRPQGNHPGPFRLLTVCELTPRKGVDLLLEAMPAVWAEHPDTELHIMGNGDAAGTLRSRAAELDKGGRIVFHGPVSEPYQRMADFDLFVLGSRSDNLPVVLLEAMLAGLPVLGTNVGGVADLVSSGTCGTVVEPESAAALSQGILDMLARGRTALRELGEQGEACGRREFDARVTTARLDGIYNRLLPKQPLPWTN